MPILRSSPLMFFFFSLSFCLYYSSWFLNSWLACSDRISSFCSLVILEIDEIGLFHISVSLYSELGAPFCIIPATPTESIFSCGLSLWAVSNFCANLPDFTVDCRLLTESKTFYFEETSSLEGLYYFLYRVLLKQLLLRLSTALLWCSLLNKFEGESVSLISTYLGRWSKFCTSSLRGC